MEVVYMYSGHIRQRKTKDGKPCYQIIIEKTPDRHTGKRKRIYKTIHGTKKDAERIKTQMLCDLDNQTYIAPKKTTVGEWVQEWYDTYIKDFKSESTLRGYQYQIENYIIPIIGDIPLQQLTTSQVQKWINKLKSESPITHKSLSSKTVRNIYMNLSVPLEKAVCLDMIKKNPCKNVTLPKKEKHEVDFYDSDEVDKLIKTATNTNMELPVMLALTLGLRRGELIALRWENVDMENNIIHICENRVDGLNGKVVTKLPKSEAGIRDIPISSSLKKLLKKYKVEFLKKKLKYNLGEKEDYVISQNDGKPYKPYSFTKKFRTFLEKNCLRHIRLHDLRHTNASIMLQQGISPKVAQQRLGHSDFSVTMNTYSHIMKTVENEAADKLDEVLFKKAE